MSINQEQPGIIERNPRFGSDFAIQMEKRIARSIPPDKTYAEALDRAAAYHRKLHSSYEWMLVAEDKRIDELNRICTALCGGDKECGAELATAAAWLPQ